MSIVFGKIFPNTSRDSCVCACSLGGCLLITIFPIYEIYGSFMLPTGSFVDLDEATTSKLMSQWRLFWWLNNSQRKDLIALELLRDMIRLWLFEKLGLRHAYCHSQVDFEKCNSERMEEIRDEHSKK